MPLPTVIEDGQELTQIERDVRAQLGGRPLQFRLSRNERGLVVEAVVPTFYSKQLLLHALQKASPLPINGERVSVPYPTRQT